MNSYGSEDEEIKEEYDIYCELCGYVSNNESDDYEGLTLYKNGNFICFECFCCKCKRDIKLGEADYYGCIMPCETFKKIGKDKYICKSCMTKKEDNDIKK